jgi:hypothetical protein
VRAIRLRRFEAPTRLGSRIAVALGRSAAPTTDSIDAALLAARTGSQGDPARPGEATVAAMSSTEPQNAVATPKNKKAQKSARGQNNRRDQYRYGAPSWREVPGRRLGSARLRAKGARLPGAHTVAGASRPISGKAGSVRC